MALRRDRQVAGWVFRRLAQGAARRLHLRLNAPEVWGHRGAKEHAPENTLPAFQLALDMGAEGIELDVHLSACRTPVVIHDDTVQRTMRGQGAVSSLYVEQLAALQPSDAMPKLNPSRYKMHEGVPSLAEVLDMLPDGVRLNVELKGPTPEKTKLEARVLSTLGPHVARLELWVSSFHPAQLWACRTLMPTLRLGLLVEGEQNFWFRSVLPALAIRPEAFHPPARFVDAELVRLAQEAGMRVHVWGIRSTRELRRVVELGVDAVLVDNVPEARRLVDSQ